MRYKGERICFAAIALTLTLTASMTRAADTPLASPTPPPDPEAIFLQAAKVTRALPVPTYAVYDLSAQENGLTLTRVRNADGSVTSYLTFIKHNDEKHFHVQYRVSDDTALMVDTDNGHRYLGAPVPVAVLPGTALSPFNKPAQNTSTTNVSSPPPPKVSGSDNPVAKVIGEISVQASQFYRVTSAGIGDEDGRSAYHLLLRARTDPARHPLTDIYVDTATYRILRAVSASSASVVIDGYKGVILINFAAAGPYWVVEGGKIEGSAHFLFQHVSGSYTFAVENPTFPATLPDSDFVAPVAGGKEPQSRLPEFIDAAGLGSKKF
jgi:hypothetical protein